MTSRVVVTAHPGSGVTHVKVLVTDNKMDILEEHIVEKDETKEFFVYDNHNLEISEE